MTLIENEFGRGRGAHFASETFVLREVGFPQNALQIGQLLGGEHLKEEKKQRQMSLSRG